MSIVDELLTFYISVNFFRIQHIAILNLGIWSTYWPIAFNKESLSVLILNAVGGFLLVFLFQSTVSIP